MSQTTANPTFRGEISAQVQATITTEARISEYVSIKERVNSEQSNMYALNNLHNYIGKNRRERRRYA